MVTAGDSNAPRIDRRVRRTQAALQRTLIRLVEDRDLSQISIADVAERAEVSRSAFYDHYRDVHELAEAACTAMIDDLIESLPALDPADHGQDPTRSLQSFFASLAEHAGLYRSLLGPHGSARVIDHVLRRITEAVHTAAHQGAAPRTTPRRTADPGTTVPGTTVPGTSIPGTAARRTATGAAAPGSADLPQPAGSEGGVPLDVPAAFIAGALIGVAAEWLRRGCPHPPAEMAASTWPLLAALHQDVPVTPACRPTP
ncbi:TetR/AcrR family transcriptional regulator [Nonomuraea sp. NPDC050643]|uniref:TetR/AcrR family transcriptional regulator n=1 Tax=Nonomuraea sp. NPDC050643 TaxID=3155660 RepID=UPI0033D96E16